MMSLDSCLVLKESLPSLLCKATVEHDSVSFNNNDEQVNCLDFHMGFLDRKILLGDFFPHFLKINLSEGYQTKEAGMTEIEVKMVFK